MASLARRGVQHLDYTFPGLLRRSVNLARRCPVAVAAPSTEASLRPFSASAPGFPEGASAGVKALWEAHRAGSLPKALEALRSIHAEAVPSPLTQQLALPLLSSPTAAARDVVSAVALLNLDPAVAEHILVAALREDAGSLPAVMAELGDAAAAAVAFRVAAAAHTPKSLAHALSRAPGQWEAEGRWSRRALLAQQAALQRVVEGGPSTWEALLLLPGLHATHHTVARLLKDHLPVPATHQSSFMTGYATIPAVGGALRGLGWSSAPHLLLPHLQAAVQATAAGAPPAEEDAARLLEVAGDTLGAGTPVSFEVEWRQVLHHATALALGLEQPRAAAGLATEAASALRGRRLLPSAPLAQLVQLSAVLEVARELLAAGDVQPAPRIPASLLACLSTTPLKAAFRDAAALPPADMLALFANGLGPPDACTLLGSLAAAHSAMETQFMSHWLEPQPTPLASEAYTLRHKAACQAATACGAALPPPLTGVLSGWTAAGPSHSAEAALETRVLLAGGPGTVPSEEQVHEAITSALGRGMPLTRLLDLVGELGRVGPLPASAMQQVVAAAVVRRDAQALARALVLCPADAVQWSYPSAHEGGGPLHPRDWLAGARRGGPSSVLASASRALRRVRPASPAARSAAERLLEQVSVALQWAPAEAAGTLEAEREPATSQPAAGPAVSGVQLRDMNSLPRDAAQAQACLEELGETYTAASHFLLAGGLQGAGGRPMAWGPPHAMTSPATRHTPPRQEWASLPMGSAPSAAKTLSAFVGHLAAAFDESMPPLEAVARDPVAQAAYSAALSDMLSVADTATAVEMDPLHVSSQASTDLAGSSGQLSTEALPDRAGLQYASAAGVAARMSQLLDAPSTIGHGPPPAIHSTVLNPAATLAVVRRQSRRLGQWVRDAAAHSAREEALPPPPDVDALDALVHAAHAALVDATPPVTEHTPQASDLPQRRLRATWLCRVPPTAALLARAEGSVRRDQQQKSRKWMSAFFQSMSRLQQAELDASAPLFNSVAGMARTALPASQRHAMTLAAIQQHLAHPERLPTLEVSVVDPSVPERLTVQVDIQTGTATLRRTPQPQEEEAAQPATAAAPSDQSGPVVQVPVSSEATEWSPSPSQLLKVVRPWHSYITPQQFASALRPTVQESPSDPVPDHIPRVSHQHVQLLATAALLATRAQVPLPDPALRPRRSRRSMER